jgi:topoisomerase-4 subunit A
VRRQRLTLNIYSAHRVDMAFIATLKDLVSRQKAGKAFMTLGKGDVLLPPANVANGSLVAALGSNGKLLLFPISEMKALSSGKGVIILGLNAGETLMATAVLLPAGSSLQIKGTGARAINPCKGILKLGRTTTIRITSGT